MAVLEGCEGKYKTPQIEERTCPTCGETIEVYVNRGRVLEDAVCPKCGYTIKAEEDLPLKVERKEE